MNENPMSFWEATILFWKNYFNFSGRSRRKEYWVPFFTLLIFFFFVFTGFIVFMISLGVLATSETSQSSDTLFSILGLFGIFGFLFFFILCLVILIPNLSLLVRRLHDIGRSGKWVILFYLVPMVLSWINLIVINIGGPRDLSAVSLVFQLIVYVINFGLGIWCIVWCATDSEPGTNKWGPNPKEVGMVYDVNPYKSQYNERYSNQDSYRR